MLFIKLAWEQHRLLEFSCSSVSKHIGSTPTEKEYDTGMSSDTTADIVRDVKEDIIQFAKKQPEEKNHVMTIENF